MVAAPYKATLVLRGVTNGKIVHMPLSASDVDAEYVTLPDGSNQLQLAADQPYMIADLIVVTGGTDTTTWDIFKNNLNASIQIVPKSNLNTSNNRQFQANPVAFESGSLLKFKQNT
jgi:hypothetical protein